MSVTFFKNENYIENRLEHEDFVDSEKTTRLPAENRCDSHCAQKPIRSFNFESYWL